MLAYQYTSGNNGYIRMFKDEKKSVTEYLNPNPVYTSEFTFTYTTSNVSLENTEYPAFGKWFLASSGTILNYYSYDYWTSPKSKSINTTGLTGLTLDSAIAATSTNLDCALTYVSGSILSTYRINTNDKTAIAAHATVIAETSLDSAIKISAAISATKIGVGANCSTLRVGDLVFIRNSGGTAYAKSAIIAGLTTPIFDS